MKNILITGGAGFIGLNLTIELISKGYNITILDNLSKQVHEEPYDSVLYNSIKDKVTFILGDICNKSDWEKALKGQDSVIHLASETGTGQSMYEIARYNKVNIIGTAHLLNILANKDHTIKRVLIASSRSIYGEGKYLCDDHGVIYPNQRKDGNMLKGHFDPICNKCNKALILQATDEDSKIQPASIYAITKQQQEQMTLLIGRSIKIPTIVLRYQNVYGPGQSLSNPYTGILSIFSTRILNGNDIDIYEDGLQSRDFVFIDDAVDATVLALENKEADYKIFNVGSGESTTVLEVASILKRLYSSETRINVGGKYRLGDIRHNLADLTKIENVLGFSSKVNFKTGITKFVKWVKTQDIRKDKYEDSIKKLTAKGFIK